MNLRKFAEGKECQLRAYGVCNRNSETVVLAHVRKGNVAGMGQKPPDSCAILCCSSCHDLIDGRLKTEYSMIQIESMMLHGLVRTLALVARSQNMVN